MDSGIQMFTTDSVSTISSGKIVAQTSTFEQTSMTDDDPGIRIIGDNKVELVYKNKVTNEEASIDYYNSNNSSNNAKLYIDNPRGTTSLIIDQNRRLGVGNIVPEAILHLHNHNNSNSEHIRITNHDNLGMNMILTSSNTDIKANFGIRWYNSGSTTLVNNALVIRNLNGTNTIGIGTSTPSYTLDVSGNINFTGTLTQNGSTYTGSYTLPTASSSTLGGIKIGNNLSINGSGVVSATDTNTTYSVGDGGLTQNNFTNTLKSKLDGIATSANNYSLPAATSSSLGGIKVGTGLSIDSGTGVLSTNITSVGTLSSLTVSGDATFDTSTLKVDSSNNRVGIGTTSPSYTLDVSGNINFTGTLTQNGSTYSGSYTLPTASSSTLGGIKVGTNLSIDGNGVLSATDTNTTYSVGDGGLTQNNFTNTLKTKLDGIATSANNYTLPTAASDTLGGVKVGTNLSISSGVLSATDTNTTYSVGDGGLTQNNFTNTLKTKLDGIATSANNYTLPTATSDTLGGVKVGTNLSISSGVLSATDTNTTYSVGDGGLTQNNFTNALKTKLDSLSTLPTASSSTLGGIKVGTNLSISSGVLSATDTNTTYSVGDGGLTQNNFTNALKTKLDSLSTLPTASSSTLGGIKVGTNLSISSGVLSATDTNTTYSVGDGGLTQNNFTNALKTKLDSLSTLPTASSSTLGGVKVDGSTITINGSGVISSSGGSSAWTTNGSDIYRSSGNVGIGTTTPDKYYYNASATGGSFTSTDRILAIHGGTSGQDNGVARLVFACDANHTASIFAKHTGSGNTHMGFLTTDGTAAPVERMMIDEDGKVGIGTTSPTNPLHVKGSTSVTIGAGYTWTNSSSFTAHSSYSQAIGLRVEDGIWSEYHIFNSSDRRIKENIEDVPDKLSLEQLRNIPCRYYEYRDKLSRGSDKTIGFIAQEVKSVLPMAVSIETSIIPNVYTNILDVTWEEITETNIETVTETNTETGVETNVEKSVETKKYKMRTSTLTNISGVKYKFYVGNSENDETEVEIVGSSDNTFTFEQQWTNVFCYGREVDDFHTIDKNKLFALNFSATQEIDRVQQQELTKVKDLEIENFLLKERVKDLESKMNDVLNRLAQLENN